MVRSAPARTARTTPTFAAPAGEGLDVEGVISILQAPRVLPNVAQSRERAPSTRVDFLPRSQQPAIYLLPNRWSIVARMAVKLHRCSTRWKVGPCWRVQKALDEQGIDYEVVKGPVRPGKRAHLQRLSGQKLYPVIEFENGSIYREESKDMAATIRAGKLDEKRGGASSPAGVRLAPPRAQTRSRRVCRLILCVRRWRTALIIGPRRGEGEGGRGASRSARCRRSWSGRDDPSVNAYASVAPRTPCDKAGVCAVF
jgi:glutathione S-transferase-like protein